MLYYKTIHNTTINVICKRCRLSTVFALCTVQKNTQLNNRFYLVKWSHNFFSFFYEKSKTKTKIFKTKLKLSTQCFNFSTWHEYVQQISFFSCLSCYLSLSSFSLSLFIFVLFFARFFSLNLWQLIQFNVTRCELLLSLTRTLHSFQSIFKSFNSFVFLCTHCHTNL